MADEKPKSLEMRVAELEDKLSGLHITEAEMKAHNKVAALSCYVPQPPPGPAISEVLATDQGFRSLRRNLWTLSSS